jgi:hypothetical protein
MAKTTIKGGDRELMVGEVYIPSKYKMASNYNPKSIRLVVSSDDVTEYALQKAKT